MKKYILSLGVMMIALLLALAISAFNSTDTTQSMVATYQFEYISGDPSDPSNWEFAENPLNCQGNGQSCAIAVFSTYVNTSTTPASLDPSALPAGKLPVVAGSGTNKVPDPTYKNIIFDEIFNRTP